MLLATLMFVSVNAIVKWLSDSLATPQILFARYAFQLLLLAMLMRGGFARALSTRRFGLQFLRGVLMMGTLGLSFAAIRYIPLADASAVMFLVPVMITALSPSLLGEHVGARRWLGVAVGFAGALVILRPGLGLVHWAIFLALSSAVCQTFYQMATRALSRTDSTATTLVHTTIVGTALTACAAPFFWTPPDALGWLLLASIGILGTVAHFAVIRAFTAAEASVVAPFSYSNLLWAVLFGMALFGDVPDAWILAGAALIAAAGLSIIHAERREKGAG